MVCYSLPSRVLLKPMDVLQHVIFICLTHWLQLSVETHFALQASLNVSFFTMRSQTVFVAGEHHCRLLWSNSYFQCEKQLDYCSIGRQSLFNLKSPICVLPGFFFFFYNCQEYWPSLLRFSQTNKLSLLLNPTSICY